MFAQWSPLIAAAWFLPALAPLLVLIKPQLALPIAMVRRSRAGLIIATGVLATSLVIYPQWPMRWLSMASGYVGVFPIAALPFGPLLLLAFLRINYEPARLLAFMSAMPFRGAYDLTALSLIPQTQRQMIVCVCLTWLMPVINLETAFRVGSSWPVPMLFLPTLVIVLCGNAGPKIRAPEAMP
jgi:hypothetical protein